MPYTNATLSTSLDTTWNSTLGTSFSSIALITGIDLSAQLEVEHVFASDRDGNTLLVTNFMNNADVKLSDKRAVYIIPITRCTLNATTNKITAIDLPSSGNVYNYTYYLISDTANLTPLTIKVPAILNGGTLTIRRKTVTNQSLVSWVDGSKLTSAQLNLQTKQLLYLAQEMSDTLNTELARSNDITSQIADGAVTPSKISSTTDPWLFYGTIQTVTPTANLHATTRLYTLDKFFQHGVMTKDDVAPTSSAVDILETAATAGNSGLWFNPKNGTINLWAGNAWVTVAGTPVTTANLVSTNTVQTLTAAKTFAAGTVVPFTQTGTGATARTVDAKLKETVSVKDFGAVGDGVTNDTTAIQNALDSGASNIYISPGTYAVSGLSINSNQTIFGCGKASILLATIATSNSSIGVININSKSNIEIYNITVAGINRPYNNDPTQQDGDRGINCASSSNIDIHDCEVYGCWSFGIVFSACASIFATNNYIYNIGNQSNISIANASTNAIVSNNICLNGKLYGIEVENLVVGVTVSGNYVNNCSSGISINYSGNVTVTGNTVVACNNTNTISGSTGVGLNYNGTAAKPLYNITTTGNVISENNNLALSITGGHDNLIFTGNTFTNAATNATSNLVIIQSGSGSATNVNFSNNILNCKNVSSAFNTTAAISNYLFTGNNVLNPYGNVFNLNAGSLYNNFQIPKLLNASIANVPNPEIINTSLENRFWSPDKSEQFLLIFGGVFSRPIKSIFKEKIIGVYWCFNANNVIGQWILSVNGTNVSAAINGVVGQEIWNFQTLNIISNAGTTNTFSIGNTVGNIYGDYVKFRIVAL